ncbi:hypothetical protein [Streptomyces virginiae]|uniref:hypothetical protein n=1 Tax=Streptomyces virginiae TaxID=1961 RepID=UPI0036905AC0
MKPKAQANERLSGRRPPPQAIASSSPEETRRQGRLPEDGPPRVGRKTTRMEMIGFYREMDPENAAVFREPIEDKVRDRTPYPKAEVKRYLDSGHPIFDIMESTIDVIEGTFRVPGGSSLLSDGRFVWRVDLAAYIERYNLALPAEFVEHAGGHGFSMPAEDLPTLRAVSEAASSALGFRVPGKSGGLLPT